MREIHDHRIIKLDGKFIADCVSCGKTLSFSTKGSSLKMLQRGSCRNCKRDYRHVNAKELDIYQNDSLQWCSVCSGCGSEQAYTRKDHAKQSSLADWQCKSCVAEAKGFANNKPVGDKARVYRKFKASARNRGLLFSLTEEEFYSGYTGFCELTGWKIDIAFGNQTASVDRIDNSRGYVSGNIQRVHGKINMSRGKSDLDDFVAMCVAVANFADKPSL